MADDNATDAEVQDLYNAAVWLLEKIKGIEFIILDKESSTARSLCVDFRYRDPDTFFSKPRLYNLSASAIGYSISPIEHEETVPDAIVDHFLERYEDSGLAHLLKEEKK